MPNNNRGGAGHDAGVYQELANAKRQETRFRRVWSIDLESVWLPFFTATNVMGETAINADALGAPLRLAYSADGEVKFSKTGRPVTKVVKELAESVKLIRENFAGSLQAYANGVITENPDAYKVQIEQAGVAGEPIRARDSHNLEQALAQIREQELAEAQAEAKRRGKAEAKAEAKAKEKVAVTS